MTRAVLILGLVAAGLVIVGPATAGSGYRDDDYLRFADRVVTHLDRLWDPVAGCYQSGAPGFDAEFNATLLVVHATAAAVQWRGPARNDERGRRIADRLTRSPPYWTDPRPPGADSMFHRPGWSGRLAGPELIMHVMIDAKVAEGLYAAHRGRRALRLSRMSARMIVHRIRAVANGPFFRYPRVRLNQINWPLELHLYDHLVSGRSSVLAREYRMQVEAFLRGVQQARNLSPSYRFLRSTGLPPSAPSNLDSPEYANIVLQFLDGYGQARKAGMAPLPRPHKRLLRAWVRRALYGYWTHAGFLSWDTGMGFRRWMKGKYWAYAQRGLLTMAAATRFRTPTEGAWAKTLFDRGLALYDRMYPSATSVSDVPDSSLYGVWRASQAPPDDRMFAARMAANAATAVSAGLGRAQAAQPPPFYAFDADTGRLTVSTPTYATAVVPVHRGVLPYGGIELARLFDADGDPLSNIGGRGPAAFGVVVQDRSRRHVFASQIGLRRDPRQPPLTLVRSPEGPVNQLARQQRRAIAGPFNVLTAIGRRHNRRLGVMTTLRFTPNAIDLHWRVHRRRGSRRYTAAFRFPSWGRSARVDAELADGRVVALAAAGRPATAVPLVAVRELHVRAASGSYAITLPERPNGTARTLPIAPQSSAPLPGPTLELALNRRLGRHPLSLRAQLKPTP